MNMSIEAVQTQPVLTPLDRGELEACLDSLLKLVDSQPDLMLDPGVVMTVRLALTASQSLSRPSEDPEVVQSLRARVEALERSIEAAQKQTGDAARQRDEEAARADQLQQAVGSWQAHAKASEQVVELVQRALEGGGSGDLGNAVANNVRRLVRDLAEANQEIETLRGANLEMILGQQSSAFDPDEIAALGQKAARVDALESEVSQLRQAAVDNQTRWSRNAQRQKADLRKQVHGAIAEVEWSARHRQHRQAPCCPACAGLKPNNRHTAGKRGYGHQHGCVLVTVHAKLMDLLAT